MSDALRRAHRPGPRITAATPAPSPLWVKTEQARKHYHKTCIAFSNREASMAQLVDAAERLRSFQLQWKST